MINQALINSIQGKKWLFVSFAPGANGYLLGKWLMNNNICTVHNIVKPWNFNLNQTILTNHDYTGCLHDIFTSPKYKDELEHELLRNPVTYDNIWTILSHAHADEFSDQKYNLVLVHYASYNVLFTLKNIFNNAKIIRIKFESQSEAQEVLKRKLNIDNQVENAFFDVTDIDDQLGNLVQNYYPYIFDFNFTIDIPWQKVKNLDLEFVKEYL